jgi:hypothetical protein
MGYQREDGGRAGAAGSSLGLLNGQNKKRYSIASEEGGRAVYGKQSKG